MSNEMANISIHDNIVTGYSVSCEKHEIAIHTEFRDQERKEQTDIVFLGVETYYIIRDNMQSIIFSVDECSIDKILEDFSAEFDGGIKYCWPGVWNQSETACKKYFKSKECKGWRISSSYGMSGFVIAKSMELKRL